MMGLRHLYEGAVPLVAKDLDTYDVSVGPQHVEHRRTVGNLDKD